MTQITLKELKDQIDAYESDCSDSITSVRNLKFIENNGLAFTTAEGDSIPGVNQAGQFNPWSFNQACGRLNAPTAWLSNPDYCPEPLKLNILNELSSKWRDDASLLLRLKGNLVRAFLTSKYSRFDNGEFVDLVGEAVQTTTGLEAQVNRPLVGDELKAYIVFPKITFGNDPSLKDTGKDNGGLHPAIYISNSERGGGYARVTGAVYRSICTNGLIYGWQEESAFRVLHLHHSKSAMGLLVADGIAQALKLSEEAAASFIKAQEIKIHKPDLQGIVDKWASKYGISVEAKDNWLAAVTHEAISNGRANDPRLFDLVNAATYVAQDRPAEECETLERLAGGLLNSNLAR
ncbi:MAG: DUF932 domain-containing protein [Sphaerochaeta sp.]|jgi:hypothetical protein|nr:DUF932 domain-containing protein [Sphaerochaeta sp.]